VRSHGLLVARRCRQAACSDQVLIRRWASHRGDLVHRMFSGGPLGKYYLRPLGGDTVRLDWSIPAIEISRHCLAAAGPPRTSPVPGIDVKNSFHSDLRKAWDGRHKVYEHDKMPKLTNAKPSAMTSSSCRLAGPSHRDMDASLNRFLV
jgi:hypothetical protein